MMRKVVWGAVLLAGVALVVLMAIGTQRAEASPPDQVVVAKPATADVGTRAKPGAPTGVQARPVVVDTGAQAQAQDSTGCPKIDAALIKEGDSLFHGGGNCQVCHGTDAKGGALAPNLTNDKWRTIDGSYASIIKRVRTGVATPKGFPAPMPPMGGAQLKPGEVCAVASYVYSLNQGKTVGMK